MPTWQLVSFEGRFWDDCLLELQGGNLGGKACYNAGHFPWPQRVPRGSDCSTFCVAIVLSETAHGVWRASNVQTLVADGGAEEVAAVEGGYRPIHDDRCSTSALIRLFTFCSTRPDEVSRVCLIGSLFFNPVQPHGDSSQSQRTGGRSRRQLPRCCFNLADLPPSLQALKQSRKIVSRLCMSIDCLWNFCTILGRLYRLWGPSGSWTVMLDEAGPRQKSASLSWTCPLGTCSCSMSEVGHDM